MCRISIFFLLCIIKITFKKNNILTICRIFIFVYPFNYFLASLSTSYSNLKNIFRRNSPHLFQSLTFLYFDISVGPGGVSILTHIDQLFYCVDLLENSTHLETMIMTYRKPTRIWISLGGSDRNTAMIKIISTDSIKK
jgi:hypothetical protein